MRYFIALLSLIIILFTVSFALYYAGRGRGQEPENVPAETPDPTHQANGNIPGSVENLISNAEEFYSVYFSCLKATGTGKKDNSVSCLSANRYTGNGLVENLEKRGAWGGRNDPVMCANSIPTGTKVYLTTPIPDGTADLEAVFTYGNGSESTALLKAVLAGNEWKVEDIRCPA